MKNAKKILLFTFIFLTLFLGIFNVAKAQPCGSAEECQKLIDEYTKQIGVLQGAANTLKNQIAQFDAQIKLTSLKISQTQEKILLLSGRIDQLEVSLDALTTAFSERAVETYKMSRFTNAFLFIATSNDLNEASTRFHYLQKIQEADRSLLTKLSEAQISYKSEKSDQEQLQAELEAQKKVLNSQKLAKNTLLSQTQNDEKKYQQLLTQARAQLAAFRRFVIGQGGASILSNQTKCDSWGCYYNQRDSLWGNMSLGGSPYSVAEYGCLVTSVSMMASHMGRNIKPSDIAANPSAFVPGTGYLYWNFSVNGVNVTVTKASKDILDSELAAGRPVIAGLYSGPDHFIVILRKEGDKYIMNDPFLENGSNRVLTDKYHFSDITTLRLVSFN